MNSFPLSAIVDNLILRVLGPLTAPHPELEAPAPRCSYLWTKDYDVFSITSEQEFHEVLLDAARIASEVAQGDKAIHIEPSAGTLLHLPPCVLKALAEADCTVEWWCDGEDEE